MSWKKTLSIALIFIALAGLYVYDHQRMQSRQSDARSEAQLLMLDRAAIQSITLEQTGTRTPPQTIQLERSGGHWRMTRPVETRAGQSELDTLLSGIEQAQKSNRFTPESLPPFGLDKPWARLALKDEQGKEQRVAFGNQTPDGASLYARIGDEKEIFTIPSNFGVALRSSPLQLRDKRLLPADLSEATTVTLAYDSKQFTVARQGDQWNLVEPMQGKADAGKIGSLLMDWNNARTSNFIDTDTLKLEKYGLDQPYVRASAWTAGDEGAKEYTLLLGSKVEQIGTTPLRYAQNAEEPRTAFVVNDDLTGLLRPTLDDLRDKQLYTLKADDVASLTLRVLSHYIPLSHLPDGTWRLADEPSSKLDQALINRRVSELLNLKAMRFFEPGLPAETTGLGAPNVQATVVSRDGLTSQTLMTGRKADDGDFVYCLFHPASDAASQTIGVDWTKPGEFFLTREDLYDKKIFDFDINVVTEIQVIQGSGTLTLKREPGGAWNGDLKQENVQEARPITIEAGTMNMLLFRVQALEWKRRLDPSRQSDLTTIKTQTLESPLREIILYDATGEALVRLGQGGETERNIFVRAGSNRYYAIDRTRYVPLTDALNDLTKAAGRQIL